MAALGSAPTLPSFPHAPRISHRRSPLLDSLVRKGEGSAAIRPAQ